MGQNGIGFFDDFSDGSHEDESPVTWSRYVAPYDRGDVDIVDDRLVITPDPTGTPFLAGAWESDLVVRGQFYRDVEIRTKVRTDVMAPSAMGVGLSGPNGSYLAGSGIVLDGSDRYVYLGYGNFTFLARDGNTKQTYVGQDLNYRLALARNVLSLTVWPDGQPEPQSPQLKGVLPTAYDGVFGEPMIWATSRQELVPMTFDFVEVSPGIHPGGSGQIGRLGLDAAATFETKSAEGHQPGLLQRWYSIQNLTWLDGVYSEVYDPIAPDAGPLPDVNPFHSASTWWTGSQQAVAGLPSYPIELAGRDRRRGVGGWNLISNDSYTVYLTGELFIPEAGTYRFLDGVDDFVAFGIDLNRDGFVEDIDGEFLINDNDWTDLTRDAHNGGLSASAIPSATFPNIAEGGEWYTVEVIVGETRGADAGIIYWDYDAADTDNDGIRLGDAEGFPTLPNGSGGTIDLEDVARLSIPESYLRSLGGTTLVSGSSAAALGDSVYAIELGLDLQFDQLAVERLHELVTTRMDLAGATLDLIMLDDLDPADLVPGEYQLLVADEITGTAALNVADGLLPFVDTSRLFTEGVLVVGSLFDCNGDGLFSVLDTNCVAAEQLDALLEQAGLLRGDADGNGKVEFLDFLRLSDGYGKPGQYTDGDFNKDGEIEFGDFLILSSNFGMASGLAASVPEPRTVMTLIWSAILLCVVRHRSRRVFTR